jgi:hypothetical protein
MVGGEKVEHFPAQDHVSVERAHKLIFQPSMILLSQNPEILAHFHPDDIAGLRLTPQNSLIDSKYKLDDILIQAKGMKKLEGLDIHSSELTLQGLKNMNMGGLSELRRLTLHGTSVDLAGLADFPSTYHLQQLIIMNQSIGCPSYLLR